MDLDIPGLIQSVGFPIVIALFFMLRLDKTLQAIDRSLVKLCERLDGPKL